MQSDNGAQRERLRDGRERTQTRAQTRAEPSYQIADGGRSRDEREARGHGGCRGLVSEVSAYCDSLSVPEPLHLSPAATPSR